ncbi:hypothetical protein [Dactylosporangium sp. CA-233914]|uniref:hypothetical protein n=1 Tax=Dactylosporangium sp. CA-233914 TaxID=3239934 RepID=UPI003D8E9E1A
MICGLLTTAWLVAVAALGRALLARLFASDPAVADADLGRLEFILAGVLVTGPLLIAAIGFRRAYLMLAGVTALPAVLLGLAGVQQLQSVPDDPVPQRTCVAFSGGTNTCPGG